MPTPSLKQSTVLCLLVVLISSGVATPAVVSATQPVDVSGDLITDQNTPVPTKLIRFAGEATDVFTNTQSDGSFSTTVQTETAYTVQFYQLTEASPGDDRLDPATGAFPVDGVPDIYAFEQRRFTNTTSLDTLRLPPGHLVEIKVVNQSETPVADASVELTHTNEATGATLTFSETTTTKKGWMQATAANTTGLELAGPITIRVSPPTTGRYDQLTYVKTSHIDDKTQLTITVTENEPPAPSFVVTPSDPIPNELVTFTSTSVDPDDSIATVQWDLDADGSFEAQGSSATHIFDANGTHSVTLKVVDADGAVTNLTKSITIGEPAGPDPIVGNRSPGDTDGDGLYEDVTGDGRFNVIDIGALLTHRNDAVVQTNTAAFDFNGDGIVNIIDIGQLLTELTDTTADRA